MATLARWQATIVNHQGTIQPGATVTVRRETTGLPLATIFSDRAGVVPKSNPFTADANGFAFFHALGGAYRIQVTSGSFSIEWQYVGIGTAQEADASSFLTTAGGTINGNLTINGLLSLIASTTALILRRTENDTTERTIEEFQSGSGAGNKYNTRIVGGGSNNVAEVRRFIGSTEIQRMTAALFRNFVDLQVGNNLYLDADGFIDLTEIAVPANPAANVARLYCKDVGGLSRLFFRDNAGTEVTVGGTSTGKWEEVGTTTVGAAVANVDFALSKTYAELVIVGFGLSNSATSANQLRVHVSDDGGATVEAVTGQNTTITGTAAASTGITAPEVYRDTSLTAATADIVFFAHWARCDKASHVKTFRGYGGSDAEDGSSQSVASTGVANAINCIRVNFASGNIDAGTITVYGRVA
jgi:hypothetical protein